MPRIPTERQTLTEPPIPPTDLRASHKKAKGEWVIVEHSESREAWIEIDDQHVYPLEALE